MRLTREEREQQFLEKARKVHGDRYDLSRVHYVDVRTKVVVGCRKHGFFPIRPDSFLRGSGCKKCAIEATAKAAVVPFSEFVAKARKVHGNKYEYDESTYKSMSRSKMRIKCPVHGWFWQEPTFHVLGNGCPKCAHDKLRIDTEEVLSRFKAVHGDRYDYSGFEYKGYHEKSIVICREDGPFAITPADHIAGKGCRACGKRAAAEKRKRSLSWVQKRIEALYGNTLRIIPETYKGTNAYADFECIRHGRSTAWVSHVLNGHGCRKCANEKTRDRMLLPIEEVDRRLRLILPKEVQHDIHEFSGIKNEMTFVCPGCGVVKRTPDLIFQKGFVCRCKKGPNGFEQEVLDHVSAMGFEAQYAIRGLLGAPCSDRHEIDVWVPSARVGIECHGAIWHSTMYREDARTAHLYKYQAARSAGIRLIQVYDYEWADGRTNAVVKDIINRALGVMHTHIGARNLRLSVGKLNDSLRAFFFKNHLLGPRGGLYAWLEDGAGVVSAMAATMDAGRMNITRYASRLGYHVAGGFGRLFKALRVQLEPEEAVFYVDRRFFTGAGLEHEGFVYDGEVAPRYVYVTRQGVYAGDRRSYQKARILERHPEFDPSMTEVEMTRALELYQLYDAGKGRYIWRP